MSLEPQAGKTPAILKSATWIDLGIRVSAVVLALLFTSLVLIIAKAEPLLAYKNIILGAFQTTIKFTSVLAAWVPLVIVTSGLLFTFTAGLWNIGMEGQIILGAVFTVGAFRLLDQNQFAAKPGNHVRIPGRWFGWHFVGVIPGINENLRRGK